MLYLYESTKFISIRPLAICVSDLRSSTAWKEASCVMVPSLSVSRQGLVIPLLDCLLFTILAVSRNCLICSLLRFGWFGASAAVPIAANSSHARAVHAT